MKYEIDDETRGLLEEVLQLAQRVVDLQYNDDIADDLQTILEETADRFGIRQTEVIVEDDGAGKLTITLRAEEQPKPAKPTLTIVADNDKPEGPKR